MSEKWINVWLLAGWGASEKPHYVLLCLEGPASRSNPSAGQANRA